MSSCPRSRMPFQRHAASSHSSPSRCRFPRSSTMQAWTCWATCRSRRCGRPFARPSRSSGRVLRRTIWIPRRMGSRPPWPRPEESGKLPVYADPTEGVTVQAPLLRAWTVALLEKIGTPGDIAADVAEILVSADRRGIASHGTARLPSYVALVEAGVMDPAARPRVDRGRAAVARIEVAKRRGESLPVGWAIGADGRPATTPDEAQAGALLPLGGLEETAGYKGYGLSLAVDILSGVLGDATFGPNIIGLFRPEAPSDLGHAFWVIDPAAFEEPGAFEQRLEHLLDQLVAADTVPDAPGRVLIPGEPEAEAERRSDARGITIDARHHASLVELAEANGVAFPDISPNG